MEETQKKYDDLKKHIDAMKGASLLSLGKREFADPFSAAIDAAAEKLKAIGNLVVGNHKAIQSSTRATIQGLKAEYYKLGMTAVQAAKYDLKDRGETDRVALIKTGAIVEAAERKKVVLAIEEQNKALEKQVQTLGMTEMQAKRFDLVMQEATADELYRFDTIAAHYDKMNKALAAATPGFKLAGAMEYGSQEAINLDLRAKGFDFTSKDDEKKKTNEKLEQLRLEFKQMNRQIEGVMSAIRGVGNV